MKKYILIALFLPCANLLRAGAGNSDSIKVQRLIEKAKEAAESSMVTSDSLLSEAEIIARRTGNEEIYAQVLFEEGVIDFNNLKYDSAISKFSRAAAIYARTGNLLNEARCYDAMGNTYQYTGNYAKSLKLLFKGLEIAKQIKKKSLISAFNISIGTAYQDFKDSDNALKYLRESLEIEKERKDTASMGIVLHNIADVYRGKKEYTKSIISYKRAIDMHYKGGDSFLAATSISDMANVFLARNELDSAVYYKQEAVDFFSANNRQQYFSDYCYATASLGFMLVQVNRLKEARQYLEACNSCRSLLSDLVYARSYYSFLYEFYKKKKDYPRALKNMELLNNIKDSLNRQSMDFENQRIGIRYEFDQKAKEDALRYQLEVSEQKVAAASYKNKMYMLLTALLVIAGLAAGIIRRIRKVQENKRRQELEIMRNNIAGDLHDDIGSTLSSIQILSSMMVAQSPESSGMKEAAGTISRLSDKVAGGIREIIWSVNPANDNLEAVTGQLRKLAAETLDAADVPFLFIKELEDPGKKLLPQVRKDLMMLFKEALNNARKYSGTIQIDINIVQGKSHLHLTIKDYGCGFDINEIKRGNGLDNMERRAKNMNAELSITSKNETGTVIDLKIPLS